MARSAPKVPLWLNVVGCVWLATFLIAIVFLPLREIVLRRRSARDRSFSDRPIGVQEFAVEIVVALRGKTIGADRGVAWFDRGLLGFSGQRTSFLLAYEDLILPTAGVIATFDIPYKALRLKSNKGRAEVVVRPLWGQGRGYRKRLRRFLMEQETSIEPRQWPPLYPYGEEPPIREPVARR